MVTLPLALAVKVKRPWVSEQYDQIQGDGIMSKLSKLQKGDKLHVQHDNKELIITITHIEMEKGTPTVNFKCTGDKAIHITTEFKRKIKKKSRSGKLNGSNKGRGWSKDSSMVKK